ncbi:hypothetical protein SK854_45725 [Lentzea sp. BCCO 10_0061]|uniref:Uncharacterized protein n=1 Tax=Lentzea sokolovensis TaxID=3095429 RepID=A0ABU4VES3_9PSEU|nr:hypothetical protein [Lentzea sp. BCCO 10_0061]MDX8149491.1 hypothetical protein [Lentzea sp. BCCO 10_0061]
MTEGLEDVLRRLLATVKNAGEAEAAGHLLEHLTTAAMANELQAAVRRRDQEATRFHTEALERQMSGLGPLRFATDG